MGQLGFLLAVLGRWFLLKLNGCFRPSPASGLV